MSHNTDYLRVHGKRIRLSQWDPRSTQGCASREAAVERTAQCMARIDKLQYRLYGEAKRSLLIVLQGMDTSGKDGVIRHVMSVFNPQGCNVSSFKVPTQVEASHDFLWRIQRAVPANGEIRIFNRSHYEDVLVARVRKLVPHEVWFKRYAAINDFERYLVEHGTTVLKLYPHISRKEQGERLLARLDDPLKRWKFSDADLAERTRWRDYQLAYGEALERCSTKYAPWYVIPADRKWYRDWAVSEIVSHTLQKLNPQLPEVKLNVPRLRARLRTS